MTVRPSTPGRNGARERVREALRCPYCHDGVEAGDCVACRRAGCGAIYHRECWDEVVSAYGACAALGCDSTRARDLTQVGFVLRVLRLLVAAVIFPPRAVAQMRASAATAELRGLWATSRSRVDRLFARANSTEGGCLLQLAAGLCHLLCFVLAFPAGVGGSVGLLWLTGAGTGLRPLENGWIFWIVFLATPVGMLAFYASFYATTRTGAALLYLAAALLKGEVASLQRADAPGSYLARVARQGAAK